ncbi:NAD regulator [Brevundimonas naejangsanensis]|uniref:NAD regulator n=1 Tax=Brevundimonas naejangsanensis TaxID=588932 RepID=A0A494RKD1_9CAUL|nr:NAD regulator [Brevundimonas naejangsanensis]AYG95403.1 NAD regulator [Brevundimonas naejangsanensis]
MAQGRTGAAASQTGIRIGLSAVIIALRNREAAVLTTHAPDGAPALPFGPFDPARDRTFELALRAFVAAQTGFPLGFVEQLYTFGDLGRASPRATPGPDQAREVSVGYLALTADAPDDPSFGASGRDAAWTPIFDIFPWEDWRRGRPALVERLGAALSAWAGDDAARRGRAESLFALSPNARWNEERVLERYELLYEAGLLAESARDHQRPTPPALGDLPMTSDHRRILATGVGRLRSKLKYRPVLFDLTPETFTLSELQAAAEAVAGLSLHKQNFRRGVERAGLVQPTGVFASDTGGRPAELFRHVRPEPGDGGAFGLSLPGQR